MASGLSPERPGFSLPVGTVTFLLTDVEGSTQRWEQAPTPMSAAIARHYELLDAAIVENNGVRPVEQGEGDSVVGAFARASDAIAAALDAQRRLAAEVWPHGAELAVRIAIHTGEAELRDEGNYFGPAVIRCARLRAIARGGQVLVSGPTAEVVGDRLPAGATFADLGSHRLKDLGRPERVWELRHPDLPSAFGPLRSLDNLPNNLPVQLTTFVGRRAELAELRDLVATTRLLSLNGAGGCGKTRMALQLAAEVLDRYTGGAWIAELATVVDPDRVPATIASVLGERDLTGDLVEAIASRVGDAATLVIFDNCEHLLVPIAMLVDTLLRRCPSLTVLATSREPLGVPGEIAWRVPSMATPRPAETVAIETLSQFDAVRLFVDRATKARPNFRLSNDNAAAVAQICHRLDGIPLAVELAAARVRGVTVEQVAAGLDDRFRLLTGGARTVLPRQQTLQASVDWGYELLSDAERAVFRRLSVFASGFTLDAAEQVVADDGIERVEVLGLLVALVDKSMIDSDDDRARYRMLESLRQYAAARLVEAGETAAVRNRHLAWATTLFDFMDFLHSDRPGSLGDCEDELDNLHAAFEWAVLAADADSVPLLGTLLNFSERWRGDADEAVEIMRRALEVPDITPRLRLIVTGALAWALYEVGEFAQAAVLAEQVVSEAGDLDDDARCVCLRFAAFSLMYGRGFVAAFDLLLDSADAARRARRLDAERIALSLAAVLHVLRGEWREAEALAINIGGDPAVSIAANNAANARHYAAWQTGRFEEARSYHKQLSFTPSIRIAAAQESSQMQLDVAQGRDTGAAARLEPLLDEARRRGFSSAIAQLGWAPGYWRMLHDDVTGGALELLTWRNETPDASRSLYSVHALLALDRIDDARTEIEAARKNFWGAQTASALVTAEVLVARSGGDLTAAERLAHEGLADQHVVGWRPLVVHTLEALAGLAAVQESYVECARLAGAAQALRDEMGYVLRWPYEQRTLDADVEAARAALGNGFDAAFAEGLALDEDAVVAYAQRARGERKRPTTGWQSLTPTESDIVGLVAEGLTNKQIGERLLMGAETVKTHVSHVYDKLGVRSRAALAVRFSEVRGG